MKTKLNSILVGSFVIGALALIVAGLLLFPVSHFFSKPARFVAYFNESVQGLDAGSAVKLRGVRAGRVLTIRIRYDAATRKSQVEVVGELDQSVISDPIGHVIKLVPPASLQRLIDEGLRAQIALVGITGLQYVELDFMDPLQNPAPTLEHLVEYPVIPTLRSGMSEVAVNLSRIVGNVSKIDFVGLSREVHTLVSSASQQLDGVELKQMLAKVAAAAESIESLTASSEARSAFSNLHKTTDGLQALMTRFDAQIEPVRLELVQTMHSFQAAAESVHQLLGAQGGLGEEATQTLRQIRQTAESVQELADFLERNPNSLIRGRKQPGQDPDR